MDTTSIPPDAAIEVSNLPNGIVLKLPRRPLGGFRYAGLVPLGFGLLFSGFAVKWILGALETGFHQDGSFAWPGLFFALFGVPFFIAGLMPMGIGCFMIFGNTVIEWRNGILKTTERAGPFWWTHKCQSDGLERLLVTPSSNPKRGNLPPAACKAPFKLAALSAEFKEGKPLALAVGYPAEWLQTAASHLAARGAVSFQTSALPQPAPRVETVTEKMNAVENDSVETQPPGSDIRCEKHNGRQLFVVPPAGLIKGSKGLFVFGVIWCGFILILGGFFLFGARAAEFWIPLLFFLVFLAIGVALLLGAIQMGRRRAMLSAGPDGISIVVAGLFGTRRWDWTRGQIRFIRTGPSGMEVNNQPVIELQLHTDAGRKKGFLAGRKVEELKWLATQLRKELGVPADESENRS
jgi:hypothetical protein